MNQIKTTSVFVNSITTAPPFVSEVVCNDSVIGYISANRDWNKDQKTVSVISPEGKHVGDFCCIQHAAIYLVKEKNGESGFVEVMKNTEIFSFGISSDFLDALLYAFAVDAAAGAMKGKRPH